MITALIAAIKAFAAAVMLAFASLTAAPPSVVTFVPVATTTTAAPAPAPAWDGTFAGCQTLYTDAACDGLWDVLVNEGQIFEDGSYVLANGEPGCMRTYGHEVGCR